MKRLILLVCLMIAVEALAQQNARLVLHLFPPDSCSQVNSTAQQASAGSVLGKASAAEQILLTDWLRERLFARESPRIVMDGIFRENMTTVPTETKESVFLPWDSATVLHWGEAGADSFLVSASRIGCPGTEVAASVAVSFPTNSGWSSPPIRFGPLGEHIICPLGHELVMEVFGENAAGPFARLRHYEGSLTSRK